MDLGLFLQYVILKSYSENIINVWSVPLGVYVAMAC